MDVSTSLGWSKLCAQVALSEINGNEQPLPNIEVEPAATGSWAGPSSHGGCAEPLYFRHVAIRPALEARLRHGDFQAWQ
jgi:hypothetical protein